MLAHVTLPVSNLEPSWSRFHYPGTVCCLGNPGQAHILTLNWPLGEGRTDTNVLTSLQLFLTVKYKSSHTDLSNAFNHFPCLLFPLTSLLLCLECKLEQKSTGIWI